MNRIIIAVFVVLLTLSQVNAQTTETAAEPSMSGLFEKVTKVAEDLQASLADLESNIQESRNSIEKGGEVLDEMLASVTAVHDSMAEESEIWSELDALLDLWEQRRKTALEKSETNPAFLKIADEWKAKIHSAKELRKQISEERANSIALMQAIGEDREMVLAYYELGQADKALESLTKVSDSLVALNENMQTIVQTAGAVEQPIPSN